MTLAMAILTVALVGAIALAAWALWRLDRRA